ncbi:MAG: hypothetical protein ACRDJJ_10150 [Actinomycetota bacterium]
MLKRAVVIGLVLALSLPGYSAWAGKKKPKPYKSEEVTLLLPHPVVYNSTGSVNSITAKEFEARCETPTTNGLDAYVFKVPKPYQKIEAVVEAKGSATVQYDLDIYLYDKKCTNTLAFNSESADEVGTIPKGTAWVLIHNYLGDPGTTAHIELKA